MSNIVAHCPHANNGTTSVVSNNTNQLGTGHKNWIKQCEAFGHR